MVKITLEYPSIDAAIVAMAKLTKADGVTINAEGKPRKGRTDAGKPRGPYRKGAGEGSLPDANTGQAPAGSIAPAPSPAAPSSQPAAPETESPASAGKDHKPVAAGSTTASATAPDEGDKPQPAGVVPAAEAPTPSAKDAEKALETLFETPAPKGGLEAARKVLGAFGVAKLRDLPADKRADFIAAVAKALE